MKRLGFTHLELIAVLAIMIILAAVLYPVLERPHHPNRRGACQSNLKQIGLAFMQYVQDYDEKFPPIAIQNPPLRKIEYYPQGVYGWADALQPYIKTTQLYQCPTEPNASNINPLKSGYTDYWYNARLARLAAKNIDSPAMTFLAGDGNDGTDKTNARYNLRTLPSAWIHDKSSPAYRHLEYANYLFADGHIKALRPDKVTTASPKKSYTFAPR